MLRTEDGQRCDRSGCWGGWVSREVSTKANLPLNPVPAPAGQSVGCCSLPSPNSPNLAGVCCPGPHHKGLSCPSFDRQSAPVPVHLKREQRKKAEKEKAIIPVYLTKIMPNKAHFEHQVGSLQPQWPVPLSRSLV